MTAQPSNPPRTLAPPEATPAAIRAALLPEDRVAFERDFQAAMETATDTYDLTPIHDCVRRWLPVAWSSADPAAEREMRRQADRLRRGEEIPTISLEQMKARLGR